MWMLMLLKKCEGERYFPRNVDVVVEVCVRVFWRRMPFCILLANIKKYLPRCFKKALFDSLHYMTRLLDVTKCKFWTG